MAKKYELPPIEEFIRNLHQYSPELRIDIGRAAICLGVSNSTLDHWRIGGLPPPFQKIGRGRNAKVAYRLGDLFDLMNGNTFNSTAHALHGHGRILPAPFESMSTLKAIPFLEMSGKIMDVVGGDFVDFFEVFDNSAVNVRHYSWERALRKRWLHHNQRSDYGKLYVEALYEKITEIQKMLSTSF